MKLLDRLMARQARLMASLDPPPKPAPTSTPRAHVPSEAVDTRDQSDDSAARSTAASLLESGDLAGARAALQPLFATSRSVGTLTTFARICTEQGDLANALAALHRAEKIDPADRKVWRLTAKLLTTQKRAREALVYLRRIALADSNAPAVAYVDLLRGLFRTQEKGPYIPSVDQAARAELELVLKRFEQAPGIDDELRLQFAGLYYLLSYGSPEAVRIYNTVAPCPPSHRDTTSTLVSLDSWTAQHELPVWRALGQEPTDPPRALYTLKSTQVHSSLRWMPVLADGAYMPAGYPLRSEHFRSNAASSPLMLFRGSHAELRLLREMPTELSPAVLVGGSTSYYEALVHHVAGLSIAEQAGLARELPLVVCADMPGFQQELLELLGYGSNQQIEVSDARPIRFETLHLPTPQSAKSLRVDPLTPRWYRARLVAADASPDQRKIYLLPSSSVPIVNADAVSALLAEQGFELIDTSGMTVRAQVRLFSHAARVVGPTLEGMTNIVFSSPGTKVLELRPLHWAASGGRMHFEPLARACGHDYAVQECARAGLGSAGETAINVDLERLRERLGAWL